MNLKKNFLWVGFLLFLQIPLFAQTQQYEFDESWQYKVFINNDDDSKDCTLSFTPSGNYMSFEFRYDSILLDFQKEKAYKIEEGMVLSKDDFKEEFRYLEYSTEVISVTNLNQSEVVEGYKTQKYILDMFVKGERMKVNVWLTQDVKSGDNFTKILKTFFDESFNTSLPKGVLIKAEFDKNDNNYKVVGTRVTKKRLITINEDDYKTYKDYYNMADSTVADSAVVDTAYYDRINSKPYYGDYNNYVLSYIKNIDFKQSMTSIDSYCKELHTSIQREDEKVFKELLKKSKDKLKSFDTYAKEFDDANTEDVLNYELIYFRENIKDFISECEEFQKKGSFKTYYERTKDQITYPYLDYIDEEYYDYNTGLNLESSQLNASQKSELKDVSNYCTKLENSLSEDDEKTFESTLKKQKKYNKILENNLKNISYLPFEKEEAVTDIINAYLDYIADCNKFQKRGGIKTYKLIEEERNSLYVGAEDIKGDVVVDTAIYEASYAEKNNITSDLGIENVSPSEYYYNHLPQYCINRAFPTISDVAIDEKIHDIWGQSCDLILYEYGYNIAYELTIQQYLKDLQELNQALPKLSKTAQQSILDFFKVMKEEQEKYIFYQPEHSIYGVPEVYDIEPEAVQTGARAVKEAVVEEVELKTKN